MFKKGDRVRLISIEDIDEWDTEDMEFAVSNWGFKVGDIFTVGSVNGNKIMLETSHGDYFLHPSRVGPLKITNEARMKARKKELSDV